MQCSMMPIILHSQSRQETDLYVEKYMADHAVGRHFVTHLEPAGKEFSIKQIRDLIKDTVYARNEPHLFVLHDFDTASLEAQNAFLKTLEEHKPSDRFVMEVRQPSRLLPTILSRSQIVTVGRKRTGKVGSVVDMTTLFAATAPPFNHPVFQVQNYENPVEPFDLLILEFRNHIADIPQSSSILKEALAARMRVLTNNITPQYALDRLLLFIYNNRGNEKIPPDAANKRVHAS